MKKVQLKCRLTVGIIVIFTLLSNKSVFGQFVPKILQESNEEIRSKTERVDPAGWLYLKRSAKILPGELLTISKDATGLKANDQMQVKKEWSDKYGWSHVRFQQYYKGLKVEGGEWSEHWKDCYIEIAHGKLIEDLEINENPTLSSTKAVNIAMDSIGALEYAWQNEDWEQAIKKDLEDANATYYPEAELLIGHVVGADFIKESYRLTWKFQIRATNPSSLNEVYIDAHTGNILRLKPVGDENGPATLLYGYGTQTIDTKKRWWYHILKANDNGRNIHTKFGSGPDIDPFDGDDNDDNFWWTSNITDGNDKWGANHQRGTTVHWTISESWDYFRDVHGRKGYDNDGEQVRIWADSDNATARRFRDGGREYIEIGTLGGLYLGALDICGHEFTHGMTANLSGLGGANEPGALNESFSDIFGVLIERNTEGALNNWTIAEDAPVNIRGGTIVRSLANPGAFLAPAMGTPANGANFRSALGLPDTWQGPRWYFGAFDDGGEHINCGVQNRWFNLLSVGGNHNGVNIQPIGIDNSADITYYNLSTFIQNGSQYADARQGAINAARTIFGPCSFEEIQTTNAWSACGVGSLFNGPCLSLVGPDLLCYNIIFLFEADYSAYDFPGSSFTWTYPHQWTATVSGSGNKNLNVTNLGPPPPYFPYTVQVSVTSSSGSSRAMEVVIDDCWGAPCIKGKNMLASFGNQGNQNKISKESLKKVLSNSSENGGVYTIEIYPNPSNEFLSLSFSPSLENIKHISIIDMYGRVLKEWKSNSMSERIDITNIISGLYLIRVESGEVSITKSFIKSD